MFTFLFVKILDTFINIVDKTGAIIDKSRTYLINRYHFFTDISGNDLVTIFCPNLILYCLRGVFTEKKKPL